MEVPALLASLVRLGLWPGDEDQYRAQNIWPLTDAKSGAACGEPDLAIQFLPPPFRTIAEYMATQEYPFWEKHGALDGIAADQAVIIADFGPGSDAPIVLDYRTAPPQVLRLEWGRRSNSWKPVANSFDTFAELVGIHAEGPLHWLPFNQSATLGTQGSENGTIVVDKRHPAGARITVESQARTVPWAITCGVYGWFVHTRFFETRPHNDLLTMAGALAAIASTDDDQPGAIQRFVERFPWLSARGASRGS